MSNLISRQTAIALIHNLYPSAPIMRMNRKRWEKKYKPYIECEKALEMLPSAQPKQGHWIEIKYAEEVNEMLIPNYECSECHYWERYDSNFCPNCGAKMQRGERDEG